MLGMTPNKDLFFKAADRVKTMEIPEDEYRFSIYSDYDEDGYDLSISKFAPYFDGDDASMVIEFRVFTY